MEKETKKVYKLKAWPKVLLVVLILLGVGGYFGYQKYQEYLYTLTDEYALIQLGYNDEEIKLFNDKLSNDNIKSIIGREYNEFIPKFIECNYFIFKNLDGYLSKVVTKDQDFFKYVGVDGYDYNSIISTVNTHSHEEVYQGAYKTNIDDGYAILVNKYYELGDIYEPADLVKIPWKYRLGGENEDVSVRQAVYDAYMEMWEAANQEGVYLLALSGYRSYNEQVEVYDYYAKLKGQKYADTIAARPGYSEHQTGLSLDIYSKESTSAQTFGSSNTFAWLAANAHKYGFILRYPEGKEKLTGYNYESWHYRYVGKDLAEKVKNSGLTYDEYYAFYLEK